MKKRLLLSFLLAVLFAAAPLMTGQVWAEVQEYQDNAFDKMGDWMATLGKQSPEKESILAQRKADRLARHAQKEAEKVAQEAEQTGQEAQKKLGL